MAHAYPDGLDETHARELRGLARQANPLSLIVLGALMAAALLGLAGGGKARAIAVDAPAAQIEVHTPRVLRNGLFFETRVVIAAHRDLADATLAVTPTLWRDMTVNTTLPEPADEDFADGHLRFHYGPLAAGDMLELKFDGQINPPLFAGTRGEFALYDGDTRIAATPVAIRVLP